MGYARKDVEKTKKLAKKFVRYQEGAELYSIGLTKFQEMAKEAKAVYKIDKVAFICKKKRASRAGAVAGFFGAQLEAHILHKAL